MKSSYYIYSYTRKEMITIVLRNLGLIAIVILCISSFRIRIQIVVA